MGFGAGLLARGSPSCYGRIAVLGNGFMLRQSTQAGDAHGAHVGPGFSEILGGTRASPGATSGLGTAPQHPSRTDLVGREVIAKQMLLQAEE